MDIPKDPAMLLSFINLKLRDFYSSLNDLCQDLGLDAEEVKSKLAVIDYYYDENSNQFV